MQLVYTATKQPVKIGDKVALKDDKTVIVTGFQKPHKPASTGRVYVRYVDFATTTECAYFPSVIGAEWIDREDR